MLAFPRMLVPAAEQAGMITPIDPDDFDRDEFPHFAVFCTLQLARSMRPGEHWNNAKIIARIPKEELVKMTLEDFIGAGLEFHS